MTEKYPGIAKRGNRVASDETTGQEESVGPEGLGPLFSGRVADERPDAANSEAEARSAPVKDGAGDEAGGDRKTDGAAHDGQAPVLAEILGLVKVIEERVRQQQPASVEPTKAALDTLAKSVEALGARGSIAKALRKGLARRNREFKGAIGEAQGLAKELRGYRTDLERWGQKDRRTRRRWAGLAVAAGFPAFLLLGVLVEQQFQVIPLHDPTGGWRGHVWDNYGRTIVDCVTDATRTNAEVDCPLVVRRP